MVCVLALDLATVSGWALWKPGLSKPRANWIKMPDLSDPKNMGPWGKEFLEWFDGFAGLEGVTDVVIEAPIIAQHREHGAEPCPTCGHVPSNLNMKSTQKLISLVSFAQLAAAIAGAQSTTIARSTVCKHFAGSGKGKRADLKTACYLRCTQKGWNVTSQDMADALATLDWYCHDRKIEVPWDCRPAAGPLFAAPLKGTRVDSTNKVAAAKLLNRALSFDRDRGAA